MRFRTTILSSGKTAAGIQVPDEVVEALGPSRKPPVKVTINGFTYRSTIASMGGVFMLGVSNDVRRSAGVAAGEDVDVELELDTEPREVVVPADFAAALDAEPAARAFFDGLSYSNKRRSSSRSATPRHPRRASAGSSLRWSSSGTAACRRSAARRDQTCRRSARWDVVVEAEDVVRIVAALDVRQAP